MEIEMPQGMDVVDLETAHLDLFPMGAGGERPVRSARWPGTAQQAVLLHVAPHGGVGRQVAAQHHAQIVDMQLAGPLRMILVLLSDRGDGRRRQHP